MKTNFYHANSFYTRWDSIGFFVHPLFRSDSLTNYKEIFKNTPSHSEYFLILSLKSLFFISRISFFFSDQTRFDLLLRKWELIHNPFWVGLSSNEPTFRVLYDWKPFTEVFYIKSDFDVFFYLEGQMSHMRPSQGTNDWKDSRFEFPVLDYLRLTVFPILIRNIHY